MTEPKDFYLYRTKDPESPIGVPASTTLLYEVCNNDPRKFDEAIRLVMLFVEEARRGDSR